MLTEKEIEVLQRRVRQAHLLTFSIYSYAAASIICLVIVVIALGLSLYGFILNNGDLNFLVLDFLAIGIALVGIRAANSARYRVALLDRWLAKVEREL